jgi:hypothetical protein
MSLSALASCKFSRLAQGQVSVTVSSGDGIGTPCSYNGVSESKHLHDARSVDLQTTWKSGSDGLGYSPMRAALALVPATVGIVAGNGAGMPLIVTHGRRIPMAGPVELFLSAGAGVYAVGHCGTQLNPGN